MKAEETFQSEDGGSVRLLQNRERMKKMRENAKTPRAAKVHGRHACSCSSDVDAPAGKIWHPLCLPIPSFKPMSDTGNVRQISSVHYDRIYGHPWLP